MQRHVHEEVSAGLTTAAMLLLTTLSETGTVLQTLGKLHVNMQSTHASTYTEGTSCIIS